MLTRRRFGRLLAAAAGAVILPVGRGDVSAARSSAMDPLAGYPALGITATDTALTLPARIAAGRYLVTNHNRATLGESAPNFVQLAAGQTTADLLHAPADPAGGLPDWFFTATIVGAPVAPAGATAQAIVDFGPGRYAVLGESFQSPVELEVVAGDGAEAAEPPADAEIVIGGGALTGVPAWAPRERLLWRVTAAESLPHRFQLYGYPDPVTVDQLLVALTLPDGETPPPGTPDLALAVPLGGFGVQSAGLTGWPVLDLAAGSYIALCTIQDGAANIPHYLAGEIAVFTIGDRPAA